MTVETSETLKAIGVTTLSDALDRLSIEGQCLGIMPFDRSMSLAGRAFTIKMLPVGTAGGSVGDYIDDVEPGQIVAIDNNGRMDATVWGDILTMVADRRKIGGTVIDGVCRDIGRSIEVNYPIFARGNTMRTGKDRVTAASYNVPVQIAGTRVAPGDWIVGDADGVVVLPAERLEEIIGVAKQIADSEAKIRNAVLDGARLDKAREQLRYHTLQSRPAGLVGHHLWAQKSQSDGPLCFRCLSIATNSVQYGGNRSSGIDLECTPPTPNSSRKEPRNTSRNVGDNRGRRIRAREY
jgi:4-hydroxy-4-methyl-2-oxoglutarate aldolase